MKITSCKGDRALDTFIYIMLGLLFIMVAYPLYFIVIASFSEPNAIYRGEVMFWIKGIQLEGYKTIFNNGTIWNGYKNSLFYMALGTAINIFVTIPAAYALSRKNLFGRNFIMFLFTFTMFFGGGLIPVFLLVKNLGMYDTVFALVIPSALSVYNMIIARSFFITNNFQELLEASKLDGCDDFKHFFKIVLPLSKAIIAVMVLYYGVGHWNTYFSALIYLQDTSKYPLQLILRQILVESQMNDLLQGTDMEDERRLVAESIKFGVIIVASLPVLIIYPVVQKYFVQGVMIGSLKG